MKKIGLLLMMMILIFAMTGCSDEYLSVVQDRAEEGQEVARLSIESDHLIRAYMVSEDGTADNITQILELAVNGEPYRVLIEIDPIDETFLDFENLSGEDSESVEEWQTDLKGKSLLETVPALGESELGRIWETAVEEAKVNFLSLVKDE